MTFTFTQADVEKLIESYLSTINCKIVGKFIPNYKENTVSVEIEKSNTPNAGNSFYRTSLQSVGQLID